MNATARLVDTHAHVMDPAFDVDRDAVLARARAAGLGAMVLVGYDLVTSRAAVDMAAYLPWTRASVGIHPNMAAEASEADFAEIATLARRPEVVAIGETGLDNYRHFTPPGRQREALIWHRRLAAELALPLIVHNRQADAEIASLLAEPATTGTAIPGVLHCFSSTDPAYLDRMLAAGYFVSFAGPLTFKRKSKSQNMSGSNPASGDTLGDMAARVPLGRLLVETDCPYLAPVPHRGQRNEPAYVRSTLESLATAVAVEFDALVERVWANTHAVFPAFERAAQEVA